MRVAIVILLNLRSRCLDVFFRNSSHGKQGNQANSELGRFLAAIKNQPKIHPVLVEESQETLIQQGLFLRGSCVVFFFGMLNNFCLVLFCLKILQTSRSTYIIQKYLHHPMTPSSAGVISHHWLRGDIQKLSESYMYTAYMSLVIIPCPFL